jgi:hypothetical protein
MAVAVRACVLTSGRTSLDLMMPTWSPGYCRVEDYAANVRDVTAEMLDGQAGRRREDERQSPARRHQRPRKRRTRRQAFLPRVLQPAHGDHEQRRSRLRRVQRRALGGVMRDFPSANGHDDWRNQRVPARRGQRAAAGCGGQPGPVLELIEPPRQSTQKRPRLIVEPAASAYPEARTRTVSSIVTTREFTVEFCDLTKSN